jgi:ribonuclease-3
MAVAFYLYSENPELPEGEMTRLRAELVCEQSLFQAAKSLGLGEYLRLGKGEESGGGRERPSILADAVEALLAAIFLDGGKVEADNFVRRFLVSPILVKGKKTSSDYKTTLQEIIQRKSGNQLSYGIISESGPDHSKSFVAEVLLNGKRIGTGSGKSKKEAEQAAAKNALENNRL